MKTAVYRSVTGNRCVARIRCCRHGNKHSMLKTLGSRGPCGKPAAAATEVPLFKDLKHELDSEGYCVIEGFASESQVQLLKEQAVSLVSSHTPSTTSVFSTRQQLAKTDQYFYDSVNDVSFFFEENAFDQEGNLTRPVEMAINKIGHAMHDLDPVFRQFSRSEKVADVLRALGYKRPLPVQSMYIFKQPHIGGEVVPHQDSTFLYTDPPSCVGLWLAIEDADLSNGCLWAMPKSHLAGVQRRFMVREGQLHFDQPAPEYELSRFVPLEVPAGTLVVLHGANVHYSAENTSPQSRHSYSMHFVEGTEEHVWSPENWAQRPTTSPWQPLYDDVQ